MWRKWGDDLQQFPVQVQQRHTEIPVLKTSLKKDKTASIDGEKNYYIDIFRGGGEMDVTEMSKFLNVE